MSLFVKVYTANFYMKSGNVIVCDKVKSCTVTTNMSGNINGIKEFKQSSKAENALLLSSIDLNQIEAVTTGKFEWILGFNY